MRKYLHGYSAREVRRLYEQSVILEDLLHSGSIFPPGSNILEAGCGVGAQTVILAEKNPESKIISIDVSEDSLVKAQSLIREKEISNVIFMQDDIQDISFARESFDHVFVCFVLEHLEQPLEALIGLKEVLKTNGTITVIEGDHGSCFWHPETMESLKIWQSMIKVQFRFKHNPLIGRQIYPLLKQAGFNARDVSPCFVYADSRKPGLLDGVLNKIIIPMVATAKEWVLDQGLVDEFIWDQGIKDLHKSGTPPDGTFFYSWFKGLATKI
ncbi:MAG: methyltransferase domain-containing protein [Desulfobacterales bacterium]|nr:methyltransferase domain-containing protein [Desulfobacterales bacterium]